MTVMKRSATKAWLILFLLLIHDGRCIKWLNSMHSINVKKIFLSQAQLEKLSSYRHYKFIANRFLSIRRASRTRAIIKLIGGKTIYSSFVIPSTSCQTCCISGGPARQDLAQIASKIVYKTMQQLYHCTFYAQRNTLALGRTGDGYSWTKEACTSVKSSGLLERKQARACRAAPDVMPSLVQAARDTSTVCQQAFRHRRWNCSSIERAPDYTPELLTGTREQAFVYAMSAAAAVWRLARGCALGSLAACSCATPPRREPLNSFKWGGCGDDVRSASRMAKRFLQGATPPGTGLGSSGPAAAGSRLLRRYATAAEVRPRSGGRLPPLYHHDNLLYTTKSPDYCLPDKKRGSLGTVGRQCNGSSTGYEGCEYLCCGRGHVTRTEEVLERCDCKYISCCYVKCKTCRKIMKTYECK
ncbi:Protein Wnt-11b-2 [Melipona quadrifasciata]|uniref:Protein Wnt n=1 Tax=Melipona quadrifasciata TaxID=166423 RepID=A0A0N0U5P2_9HYME|nr:Protein Wnt-11b-2 [Melipona quadrifasciata]